jgi:pimeloyl-ACP methyl ester carboxylesterase
MAAEVNYDRRRFFGAAALTVAAAQLGLGGRPKVQADPLSPVPAGPAALGPVRQIDAGQLNVGYAEVGPAHGRPVILMHGWPYDIHSYVEVAPLLGAHGYRVIVPYFRGYGTTSFRSDQTLRNGEQVVFAYDILALMDALRIKRAILGGFDWGSRTGDIIAALWPERCKALVSVTGYLITDVAKNKLPIPPKQEWAWWYQYYFAIERGRLGLAEYRHDLARLVWRFNSPTWRFSNATFDQTAMAFDNPDYVSIVIFNYRWRLGLVKGQPRYFGIENRLAKGPVIHVPTITLDGELDPFTPPGNGAAYRAKFAGKYAHRTLKGIGHNVPQEAPHAFAEAIMEVDRF